MVLTLALVGGAGLVTGYAVGALFGGRRDVPKVLPPAEPHEAIAELRTLRALCGVANVNAVRRYSLASDAAEAMQRCLEGLLSPEVRAAAVTGAGGSIWHELGDSASARDAASFAARLDHLPRDVVRVAWRSDQGIEIVAQRFPLLRESRWVVCVGSGAPVDRMRLARVAYESGLTATVEHAREVQPLGASELGDWSALATLATHTPIGAARIWTAGEKRFAVGTHTESNAVLRTQVGLHRWSRLVEAQLGKELGMLYETSSSRIAFHPLGPDSVVELVTGLSRPHPWKRAYAAARQLGRQAIERKEAS